MQQANLKLFNLQNNKKSKKKDDHRVSVLLLNIYHLRIKSPYPRQAIAEAVRSKCKKEETYMDDIRSIVERLPFLLNINTLLCNMSIINTFLLTNNIGYFLYFINYYFLTFTECARSQNNNSCIVCVGSLC